MRAEVCSVQMEGGSKGKAVSAQAGIKNILRGLFFLKLKQRTHKATSAGEADLMELWGLL